MSYFAVDRYLDQIKVREGEYCEPNGMNRFEHFRTESEARQFIVRRASKAVDDAKSEFRRAQRRYAKCHKKFGWRLAVVDRG